ncbi:MAG: hypothetical protein O9340_14420, partial [Cyclobacteriaceae bacterium]|nr:hypothetical protein [Cyclobacteriaceae bacterium]
TQTHNHAPATQRKTDTTSFQSVTAVEVIANNQKLYVNREDGFIGWGLKKDEYICDCSELDDIIVIRRDGKAKVSRIQEKVFMGKDILYVGVFKKGDDRMIYNVIYSDGKSGTTFAKRFSIPGVTRDKEYPIATDEKNSKIHYVSGNPNGEAEVVEVKLSQASTARKKIFNFDFSELEVKGRSTKGNIVTKYPVRRVDFLKAGSSTLSKLTLWYDADAGRLNKDGRGKYLGKFDGDDLIIAFNRNGSYKITNYELTNRYEPERTLHVEKFHGDRIISAVYVDGETKQFMAKRFILETNTMDKEFVFISEAIGSRLVAVTTAETPEVEVELIKNKDKGKVTETINLEELVDVKGWKALGNRLSQYKVTKVMLPEEPTETPEENETEEEMTEETQSSKKKQSSKLQLKKTDKSRSSEESKKPKAKKVASKPQATSKKAKSLPKSKPSKKVSSAKAKPKAAAKQASKKTARKATKKK